MPTIGSPEGRKWRKLGVDGLHDPENELLQYLQEPAEALGVLPKGGLCGNQVDWIAALREGAISPRTNVHPETKIRVIDLDIIFTEWLDCANCHPLSMSARGGATTEPTGDIIKYSRFGACVTVLARALASGSAQADGDSAGGEKIYKKCKACHALESG